MAPVLVRPYPVAHLAACAGALKAFQANELAPIHKVYRAASDALGDLDPDAIREPLMLHGDAGQRDRAALNAALDIADTWEGVVAVAATVEPLPRLRGFLLAAAWCRYLDADDPTLDDFKALCRGGLLPGLQVEDTTLYASLPALMGLGPELPDELPGPSPVVGVPARILLELPDEDWSGIDPIDGAAITPEQCADASSAVQGAWRDWLNRGATEGGLLIRPGR